MTGRHRRGFTLVELLVVVVIIGMLMALLIPAVNAAREAARRAKCSNNQHEIALAIHQYEVATQHLPGYNNRLGSGSVEMSWFVVLLPYLGREDLWQEWRRGNAVIPDVPQLKCPSTDSFPASTNYVANCGMSDAQEITSESGAVIQTARANGVFQNYFRRATSGAQLIPFMSSSNIKSGAGETFLFSENIQAGTWANTAEELVGMVWWSNPPDSACQPNSQRDDTVQDINHARPSSKHPGGFVVTYCDGHQEFVAEEDYTGGNATSGNYRQFARRMASDRANAAVNLAP